MYKNILLVFVIFLAGCVIPEQIVEQPVLVEEYKYCFTSDKGGEKPLNVSDFSSRDVIFSDFTLVTDAEGCVYLNKSMIKVPFSFEFQKRGRFDFTLTEPFLNYNLIIEERDDAFYLADKIHWTHMPVTFSVESTCGSYEINKVRRGFAAVEEATSGVVYFKEIEQNPNIYVYCSFIEDCYSYTVDVQEDVTYRYESICSHKKGVAQIMKLAGDRILQARIEMIGLAGFSEQDYGQSQSGFYIGSCGHPTTEIHEILHTFGYGHKDNEESIMYFNEDSVGYTLQKRGECVGKRKSIDADIARELKETYG